jgi:peptide deformylase
MKTAQTSHLTIRKYGDPVLQKKAKPVTVFTDEFKKLLPAMFATMYAEPGIGLAAPQVGVSQRLMVVDVGAEGKPNPMVLVNPKIEKKEGRISSTEGCLSFPGISVTIPRAEKVRVTALNEAGFPVSVLADGLLSRCLQHEIDHLDGVLMIDHLPFTERFKVQMEIRKLKKAGKW